MAGLVSTVGVTALTGRVAVGRWGVREARNPRSTGDMTWGFVSAPEGIRTPNLLIRSQMLYPLSYGRMA